MYFPYFHELKSLYNGASYQNTDGRKVLYLNGSRHSYAETPALPIRAISFSIMCWIKVLSLPSDHVVHIYSDWSEPHHFRIYISGWHGICAYLRNPHGHDIVYPCIWQVHKIHLFFSYVLLIKLEETRRALKCVSQSDLPS